MDVSHVMLHKIPPAERRLLQWPRRCQDPAGPKSPHHCTLYSQVRYVHRIRTYLDLQDEIDDSRKTLQYAVSELQKDVEKELLALPESQRDAERTEFAIFVVHNKIKPKLGKLPSNLPYVILIV